MSLLQGQQIRLGAFWSYAGQVYLTAGHFIVGVLLARLLGPGDFGVFIAVTAFTSVFLMGVQFGLPAAILQARELEDRHADAAFWTMTGLGVVFLGIAAVVAGPLSTLYDDARFIGVMLWMAGTFLLTPYTAVGLALLRRRMQFDHVARIEMISFTATAPIALTVALSGGGVYALVLGAYAGMLINAVLIGRRLRWRPSRPCLAPVKALLGYSGYMTVNNLLHFATARVDSMLVGARLGTAPLGLYNRAYSLARMPSDQFGESLGPLMVGSLSRIQDDIDRSRSLYFKAVSAISVVTAPFLAVLLVAGPMAIELLYGSQWSGAGDPLRVMVAGALFVMLTLTLRGLISAQGLVKQLIPVNVVALLLTAAVVVILSPWGLIAISAGISVREAIVFFGMVRVLGRSRLRLRLAEVLHAAAPALLAASAALPGGLAALRYGRVLGLGDGLAMLLLVAAAVFFCYSVAILALMVLWRSHAPLGNTRGLLLDAMRTLLRRMRLRPRAA